MKRKLSLATRGDADGMAALASGFVAFEGAGSVVFAPRVVSPGRAGRPWLRRGRVEVGQVGVCGPVRCARCGGCRADGRRAQGLHVDFTDIDHLDLGY
jgi:hypothetical protein